MHRFRRDNPYKDECNIYVVYAEHCTGMPLFLISENSTVTVGYYSFITVYKLYLSLPLQTLVIVCVMFRCEESAVLPCAPHFTDKSWVKPPIPGERERGREGDEWKRERERVAKHYSCCY